MQFYHYKDLWVFRLATRTWEKIAAKNGPSPRSGHRMIALKKKLYVFGGFYDTGNSYKYYNDVWAFSLETYQWQEIKPSGAIKPAPRYLYCYTFTKKYYIFSGFSF